MIVDVNEIERCLRYFKAINDAPLEEIVWMRGDEQLHADPAELQEHAFTGLSNRDFPAVAGWLHDGIGIRVATMVIANAPNKLAQADAACGVSPGAMGSAADLTEMKMDWIDKAIRELCELPDRSSQEDDPEAIVATPGEIRAVIESNMPSGIADLQRKAIGGLLALAGVTFFALDDSEELSDGNVLIEPQHAAKMSAALDTLNELPDDQPGCVMNETAKAAWALRDLTPNAEVSGRAA